ncbi:MAG: FAD-dependent oxidoreductase [Acetobacteraceae bacterium]
MAAGLDIAVVGSGIAGLSAAWLLQQRHRVTLYEAERRPGGHSNTVDVQTPAGPRSVDTGFIVYNEQTYPNLTALFAHLGVNTKASDMSFAVSLDGGHTEYAGTDLFGLFAQRRNIARPRFWSMLRDLRRFYLQAPAQARHASPATSLGEFLAAHGYGAAFREDHLLPMAAAIWSASAMRLQDYPAAHFIRFCENHGLLKFSGRPLWRTVDGGSRNYVKRMVARIETRLGQGVAQIRREYDCVAVRNTAGSVRRHDHVVLACHADQALAMLDDPTDAETALLSAFGYSTNRAVLHSDATLMPKRRAAWASWNYIGRRDQADLLHVTYWMNRLQGLPEAPPLFVTLNPAVAPRPDAVLHEETYRHPQFDAEAMRAQSGLWSLQGRQRTWFCGAYFGAGFHEDGLQAGLAVAEQLGGVRRPWTVAGESKRIHLTAPELEFA